MIILSKGKSNDLHRIDLKHHTNIPMSDNNLFNSTIEF